MCISDNAIQDDSHAEPFQLRPYQDEMLYECLQRNSIVVLDTGAGKTHIAIARIRAELETDKKERICWFLAPTVALCHQHHKSLQTHLVAYQIRILSGEDDVDRWTEQAIWDAVLKNIRIVISTYAVLLDAMTHGFIKVSRLCLCVFDEAHNCKARHPANLIMQNFYFPAKQNNETVPHILGLSASPVVNAKTGGLEVLEANLDSHVITPKLRRAELMQYVHVPELIKYTYRSTLLEEAGRSSLLYQAFWRLLQSYDLELDPYVLELKCSRRDDAAAELEHLRMSRKTFCLDRLNRFYNGAGIILQAVGPSAVDWYIRACSQRMANSLEQSSSQWMPDLSEKGKRHLTMIMKQMVNSCRPLPEIANGLSTKTELLLLILLAESGPTFTGIVFVEQRSVVAALAEVIRKHPMTADIFKVGTFVGSAGTSKYKREIGDIVEPKGQQKSLDDFRAQKKNLIIATSVLEEGIDVSSCQTIICFDPPKNLTSFVQRRGRARKKNSKYIVLLGDGDAKADPAKWHQLEDKMKAAYTSELRDAQLAAELEDRPDFDDRQYKVASTGALLTAQNANAHLHHFCATLLTSGYSGLKPMFSTHLDTSGTLVTAEVSLPIAVHASVRRARSSRAFKTERAAMADAAFEAYIALHKAGLVNDNLLPLRTNVSDVAGEVPSRPSLIKVLPRLNPWTLHSQEQLQWSSSLVHIRIGDSDKGSLVMHLPFDCPPLAEIDIFWNASTMGSVHIAQGNTDLPYGPEALGKAYDDTMALLSAVSTAGSINPDGKELVALFQPDETSIICQGFLPASEVIMRSHCKTTPKDYGLLRSRQQFGRAFIFERIVNVQPTDTINVQARRFPKKRDLFNRPDTAAAAKDTPVVELSLDDCTMDLLPARYAFAAACIPSILYQIEGAVLARKLQQTLLEPIGLVRSDLIIEATTASSANFEKNYERLEYLGDVVLKFCTHVQLMAQHPTWPESYLTTEKGRTNGNVSLASAALRVGVDRFISTKAFTAHHWQPPYYPHGNTEPLEKAERSTKTLADVVEALIGASFHDKGLAGARACIRIFLPDELWYTSEEAVDLLVRSVPSGSTIPHSSLLESIIGYRFNNQTLLLEAITHSSYTSPDSTLSYERLEFLGDAILDQIVVPELFRHEQPPLKNHQMHRLRQCLANGHFLGFLCMGLSVEQERTDVVHNPDAMTELAGFELVDSSRVFCLYDFLRCGSQTAAQRSAAVAKYSLLQEEIQQALDYRTEYPWPLLFELHPPKMFSDLIESVLGAIFIDSRGSLEACSAFLERCGLLRLMRRLLSGGVQVEYPKQRLGILADKKRVFYNTRKVLVDDMERRVFECTVKVGEREVVTVGECAHVDEAEVKGALEAVRILESERVGYGSDGNAAGHGFCDADMDGDSVLDSSYLE